MAEGNIAKPSQIWCGFLYCNSSGEFPVSTQPVFVQNNQLSIVGRNISSGAVYLLYYRSTTNAFAVMARISGSAPQEGEAIYAFYPI